MCTIHYKKLIKKTPTFKPTFVRYNSIYKLLILLEINIGVQSELLPDF